MATKLVCVLLLAVVVLKLSAGARSDDSPCGFPAIFNLGDSNSDTGAFPALFPAVQPPYGRTFFGMPAGRQSDGRLTIDFMAQSLGLRYLSAYLDSLGSNFTQGANFASAAGTIRRVNGSLWTSGYSPISLDVQVWQLQQFINRSRFVYDNDIGGVYREILPNPEQLISKALYTLDMGQNDLTVGYFDNMTTEQVEAYVPDLMERISSAIQTVYNLGGRHFWVHNTAPLGCLPYALVFRPDLAADKDAAGCSVALNAGARFFNARLKETVARLRDTLPGAALTYVDVYAAKYRLISQAKELGFGDPLRVCCGYGGGEYNFDRNIRCGDKVQVNGTSVLAGKSCDDPSRSVSWDGVHFTEAANRFVFDQIVDGALSDPPVPLRRACQGKRQ
ncbi:GDSL esterase/lipase ACHE-like [Hordeum vulgare subsp. vulgare]|uniref:GDSL esterase/lipase n=2 Tax=Hordeum vulgare subsp. vulgare TaxID=112509 RepID=A0A8I6WW44_HORVV|nr:GDSL esterase/lipase ACHE-like [Hordeum vulgare subsp. vulgare]